MKTTQTAQVEYALLYLLTGKYLSELFPRQRGVKHPELVSCGANCKPPKPKKTRSHCPNPHMRTGKELQDNQQSNFRTHSNRITEHASTYGCRIMSNKQKLPTAIRELPYHRPFHPDERPNVGPQPVRN